jgi:tetratricopeptide (TPR) repeat protein
VTGRADALQVVEAIELLLDADQWQPADDLYRNRSGEPSVWKTLPAARLGQRANGAFVATSARRAAFATHLESSRLGLYLNNTGFYAMNAGDLATAREYLSMGIRHSRDVEKVRIPAVRLLNLAECLGHLGHVGPARDAVAEALRSAETAGERDEIHDSRGFMGWIATLAGDTAEAEHQFTAADQIRFADDPDGDHLYSLPGTWWGDWLHRTGRPGPAQALTARNAEVCRDQGWNASAAKCDRLLGRLALAAGDTAAAGQYLQAAAVCFQDGDYLIELALTLAELANHAQATGDLNAAERHVTEAVTIAAPRSLVLAQSAALAARARIRATQAATTADPDPLYQGRDAADAALRLAVRHQLAWYELDALRAHAQLDHAEHADHGWADQADALHARLVPPGLDPDPLATVERLVAAQKAADPGSLCYVDRAGVSAADLHMAGPGHRYAVLPRAVLDQPDDEQAVRHAGQADRPPPPAAQAEGQLAVTAVLDRADITPGQQLLPAVAVNAGQAGLADPPPAGSDRLAAS